MVRITSRYTILFSVIFLIFFLVTHEVKAQEHPVALVIYDGYSYTGRQLQIRNNMPTLREMNKRMTSFKLKPGYVVRFYEGLNYTGAYYTRKSTDYDTLNVDFSDKAQSVEFLVDGTPEYSKPPTAVTVFDGVNHSGRSLAIHYDTPSLGSMNKKLSSFRVSPGYQVRFYTGNNYQGSYYTRDANDTDSYVNSWSKQIRSVKILKKPSSSHYARNYY